MTRIELIRFLIARRGQIRMSQGELAKIVGVSQQKISRMETSLNCSLDLLTKVIDALELDICFEPSSNAGVFYDDPATSRYGIEKKNLDLDTVAM